jgi:ubiquinone/menaquinone biosynthesis C-methylase UbiE
LLDIGCGSGALTIRAAKRFPESMLTGIDYWSSIWNFGVRQCENNARLEGVAERITFQRGDAALLPFQDESFDAVVSNFVFHEVKSRPDKRMVVREALRVVKKDGVFAFHDLFLRKDLYGDIQEFVDILKSEGISEVHFVQSSNEKFIPDILKIPSMLGSIGLLYGRK